MKSSNSNKQKSLNFSKSIGILLRNHWYRSEKKLGKRNYFQIETLGKWGADWDYKYPDDFPFAVLPRTRATMELNIEINRGKGSKLYKYWMEAVAKAKRTRRWPLLIIKRKNQPPWLILSNEIFEGIFPDWFLINHKWSLTINTGYFNEIKLMYLKDFLEYTKKYMKERIIYTINKMPKIKG